jgi:prevent-host-death family protein
MKTISCTEAGSDLDYVLKSAQTESVVILRDGKPSAVVIGVEAYDEEDFKLANSAEFWQMIQDRRRESKLIPLSEVKRRLGMDTDT